MAKAIIDELLSAYVDLRRVLGRRLGNPDDASDVAQSSFERVYSHGLASAIPSPRALLFRTAQRICIDAVRHREVVRSCEQTEGVLLRGANAVSAERLAADRQVIEEIVQRLGECRHGAVTYFYRSAFTVIPDRKLPGASASAVHRARSRRT